MKNYDLNSTGERANKYNFTLNKVIEMSSKEYFRKNALTNTREKKVIDDEDYENSIKELLSYEEKFDTPAMKFLDECEDEKLCKAIEQLSAIEQAVIFLIFSKELSREEAAKVLNVCVDTISRAKIRAINKLRKYLKGDKK